MDESNNTSCALNIGVATYSQPQSTPPSPPHSVAHPQLEKRQGQGREGGSGRGGKNEKRAGGISHLLQVHATKGLAHGLRDGAHRLGDLASADGLFKSGRDSIHLR
mmetsp:Transcript_12001/g.32524  ORF Transcript_12001/g.32524 Transcript_12001/m.32524 type:complete len:106 (+) Transcript_12001:915-1232(+)